MSQPSNESQLLRGAFIPTLVVSLVAIAIATAAQGMSGFGARYLLNS